VTAAALVASLRNRGVTLQPEGDRLRVRPTGLVTAEELEALRTHKAEVMALLAPPWIPPQLDPRTVEEVLGPAPDPRALLQLQHEVAATVASLRFDIQTGDVFRALRTVAGQPLADWLPAAGLAALLREDPVDDPRIRRASPAPCGPTA
jgi:hypothetical protein